MAATHKALSPSPERGKKNKARLGPTQRIRGALSYARKALSPGSRTKAKPEIRQGSPDQGVATLLPQWSAGGDGSVTGTSSGYSPSPSMAAAESPGSAEVTGVSRSTRAKMASFLYHSREESEQESALLELEASLAAAAPAAWKGFSFMAWEAKATEEAKMSGGDAAALAAATPSVETDTDTAASAAATTIQAHFKGRRERRRTRVQLEANRRDAAATTIQAHFKGRRERRRIYGRDTKSSEAPVTSSKAAGAGVDATVDAASLPPAVTTRSLLPPRLVLASVVVALLSVLVRLTVLPAFVGVIIGLAFRIGCYAAALYAWVRAPHILGWVLTQILTHVVLNSHPIGCETFRLWPWITYEPNLTLHLDAHATNFYYANPPNIGVRHPHLFSMRYVRIHLHFDISWLLGSKSASNPTDAKPPAVASAAAASSAGTTTGECAAGASDPLIVTIEWLDVWGLLFNAMMGRTGEFNLPALGRHLTVNEVRAELGGKVIHPYRSLTLPNVLRLKIFCARRLQNLPDLRPRVEVQVRKLYLSTTAAERGQLPDGTIGYSYGGVELILPVHDITSLVIVRVFDDNVRFGKRPALLGQWFMTIKYLIACPNHCKHSRLTQHGDGLISGTFLLTDAKLRGSAVRGHGHSFLGNGFSGELDMALHWTHSPLIDPPPPPKPMTASQQIDVASWEDKYKFGNMGELKEYLKGLPIRQDKLHFALNDSIIEISDFFSGVMLQDSQWDKLEKVAHVERVLFKFKEPLSLYHFLDTVKNQLITSLASDYKAMFSATSEIISGLVNYAGNVAKRATGNAVYAVHAGALEAGHVAGRRVGAVGSAVGAGVGGAIGAVGGAMDGATRTVVGGIGKTRDAVGRAVVGGAVSKLDPTSDI